MSEFLTQNWFNEVVKLAKPLPKIPSANLKVGLKINKFPKDHELNNKVLRCYFEIVAGQLKKFDMEKLDEAEVTVRSEYKYILAIMNGELKPEVGYMQGVIKLDGAYEKVIFNSKMRELWESKPWSTFWQAVRSSL